LGRHSEGWGWGSPAMGCACRLAGPFLSARTAAAPDALTSRGISTEPALKIR